MKSKIIVSVFIIVLIGSLVACKTNTNESGSSPSTSIETVSEENTTFDTETIKESETIEDLAENEPEEFNGEPNIIIPSEVTDIETMIPQESGEIDIEDNDGGSF